MRPIALNSSIAFGAESLGAVLEQVRPHSSPIHHLADVKLEPPYNKLQIAEYLKQHHVRTTGDNTFDDCLFQSVLFTNFFEKVDNGELKPGQPEHDKPALYLLKKSVELLQPLHVKIEATCKQYDNMLLNSPPALRATLEQELKFVQGMAARFAELESDLINALSSPLQDFQPTRNKACFLLFAHALLADAVNAVQGWMDDLASDVPQTSRLRLLLQPIEESMVRSYVTRNESRSNLFSAGPLKPADEKLCKKGLTSLKLDGIESFTVPSFSGSGSQGVLSILHGIFHGKCLLSAAANQPYAVHDNYYKQQHLSTLRHDCEHLETMIGTQVFSSLAPKLMPIFAKLEDPESNLPAQDVKKDLVVLFHMLHENPAELTLLSTLNPKKSFLDCAKKFFNRASVVADMIPLLNKVGFSIAPIDEQSSAEDKVTCYEAVAQATNTLWMEFRVRHAVELKESKLFAKLPNFLKD